eukprot:gene5514-24234_t
MSDSEDFSDDFASDDSGSLDLEGSDSGSGSGNDEEDLENMYYKTKGIKNDWLENDKANETDFQDALAGYEEVVALCCNPPEGASRSSEDMDVGFKSLKQITKLFLEKADLDRMIESYSNLLEYMKANSPRMSQGRSYTDGSIQKMIERVSQNVHDQAMLERFFSETVAVFETTTNPKQAFKTKIKLGEVYYGSGNLVALQRIVATLERSCQNEAGEDDISKGGQLFDVFKLKFPMLASQGRTKELKKEYKRAVDLSTKVVADGRVMGLIREEGGKMHLAEGQWKAAYEDYFEAFKCYEEMGDSRRLSCLKMLVLANMLDESEIDPFAAQEAKPYKNDPAVKGMTELINAYQRNDLKEFERILRSNKQTLEGDPMIKDHIADLLRNIRTAVMVKLIKPYTRIKTPYIARCLKVSVDEVEALLVACILDGTITGKIDQMNQRYEVSQDSVQGNRFKALASWASQLDALFTTIASR